MIGRRDGRLPSSERELLRIEHRTPRTALRLEDGDRLDPPASMRRFRTGGSTES